MKPAKTGSCAALAPDEQNCYWRFNLYYFD